MSLLKYILARLPEKLQKKLTVKLISSGKIFNTPVWKMLFQTLGFHGGDEKKIRRTFIQKHEGLESLISKLCKLGDETRKLADELASKSMNFNSEEIRDMYLEASMYYFAAYFFISNQDKAREIFNLASPVFDEFMKRFNPPVEKWEFKWKKGSIFAHTYYPKGKGPFPVILVYPGNEGIKEYMGIYAKYALARNIALISIEPPGFGESGLSGSTLTSIADYRKTTDLIYQKIKLDPKLDETRLASFGLSGGALTSVIVAGQCNYITAASGIGAPDFKNPAKVWKNALGEQKRKTYTYTGLKNSKDVIDFLNKYGTDAEVAIHKVKCPVLMIHGENDYITPAEKGKDITDIIGKDAIHRIIPGDDHLCSNSIGNGLADEIFDWFAIKLKKL